MATQFHTLLHPAFSLNGHTHTLWPWLSFILILVARDTRFHQSMIHTNQPVPMQARRPKSSRFPIHPQINPSNPTHQPSTIIPQIALPRSESGVIFGIFGPDLDAWDPAYLSTDGLRTPRGTIPGFLDHDFILHLALSLSALR
jgi:hypothetical protein